MRAAVFYVPEDADPLARAGASWLGRDVVTGAIVPQPSSKLACVTATPARYGFHATLKPPMRLATDLEALAADVAALASRLAPFPLTRLEVGRMGDALVLLAAEPSVRLQELADECVEALDRHRLPPDAAELARRRQVSLSPLEQTMLERWGYPYVFDTWRFHITLTSALPAKVFSSRERLAAAHFAAALQVPRKVASLALCTEASPGAPFCLFDRFPLVGREP